MTNMPQITKNSIYRRTANKLNQEYHKSIFNKVNDGVPLFIQRMSNDPIMNEFYRIEGERRYFQRMMRKHIVTFQYVYKNVMRL